MGYKPLSTLIRIIAALLCAAPLLWLPAAGADEAPMPYRIDVDLVNEVVTILKNDGSDDIVLQCLCSSGGGDSTPTGTYVLPEKKRDSEREEWYKFRMSGSYAQYATRIFGQFMFHSLPYTSLGAELPDKSAIRNYGKPVSHGCIRLLPSHAKFIAENCLPGTVVYIHKMNERDDALWARLYRYPYSADCGRSYNAYYGITDDPDALSCGASGETVRTLQLRLKDLGIYGGEITGEYAMDTVDAVCQAQALLGTEQTGCATAGFMEAIAAPDAPSSTNVTLDEGSSGPAVHALQQALRALRLYDGDMDSVYDVDVSEAVHSFQAVYGIDADGIASPTLQKAALYEANRVATLFAEGEDYSAVADKRAVTLGTVDCAAGVHLRQSPSDQSETIMSLKDADTVLGLEHGDEWSRVAAHGREGYVMNRFMRYSARTVPVVDYAGGDGATRYTLGVAGRDASPARLFVELLQAGGAIDDVSDLVAPATVRTGGQPLNLRGGQSADSAVITTIPDGAPVDALYRGDEWTLVRYGVARGYVMAKYLEF